MGALRRRSKGVKSSKEAVVTAIVTLAFLALAGPAQAAGQGKAEPASKQAAKAASKPEASAGVAMDPAVKKVVDAMQAFYERTHDFSARFDQTYKYASCNRSQQSSGTVVFRKPRKLAKGELE